MRQTTLMDQVTELYFTNKEEWRTWLTENQAIAEPIWLVFYKKETGIPTLFYDDAVEQALCFGWIDGIIKSINSKQYKRKFYPRTNFNNWSPSNRKRVGKLMTNGEMTEIGLNKIGDYANTKKLIWPEVGEIYADQFADKLMQLLKADKEAFSNFKNMSTSHQKRYVLWVMQAKREETRIKRMNEAIVLLHKNTNKLLK